MNGDFNPLDLSAAPKKLDDPAQPADKPLPKPTVRRVSMGPIFHSRITRFLALVLGLALAALIGYTATMYYLNKQPGKDVTEGSSRDSIVADYALR